MINEKNLTYIKQKRSQEVTEIIWFKKKTINLDKKIKTKKVLGINEKERSSIKTKKIDEKKRKIIKKISNKIKITKD